MGFWEWMGFENPRDSPKTEQPKEGLPQVTDMLSAYKLGTMIKISNELLNDSAFDLATYIARRFGVRMGNAEERAFITGDGVGKPLGLLAETGGAKVGVTAGKKDAVTFDEIFKLYQLLF